MNAKLKLGIEILSLIASGVVPWVNRFLPIELIGAYYRPDIDVLATVLAVLAFGWRWLTFRGVTELDPKKKWAGWSFVALAICCLLCLWISMNISEWRLGPSWTGLVRIAWCAIYVGAAVSLGVMLASLMHLIPEEDGEEDDTDNDTDENKDDDKKKKGKKKGKKKKKGT